MGTGGSPLVCSFAADTHGYRQRAGGLLYQVPHIIIIAYRYFAGMGDSFRHRDGAELGNVLGPYF